MSVRQRGTQVRRRLHAEEIGGQQGMRPLPVGYLAFLVHKAEPPWNHNTLTPGEAVLRLLDNTVLARANAKSALATFEQVVLQAKAIQGERGDARDFAGSLLDWADEASHSPC
jgi:hypothetical protein